MHKIGSDRRLARLKAATTLTDALSGAESEPWDVGVSKRAVELGVDVAPLSRYYLGPRKRSGLVERDTKKGVKALAQALAF